MEHRDSFALAQAQQVSAGVPPMTHTGEARVIAKPMGTTYEEVSNTRSSNIEAANEIMDFLETSPNLSPKYKLVGELRFKLTCKMLQLLVHLFSNSLKVLTHQTTTRKNTEDSSKLLLQLSAELNRSLNTNATAGAPVSSLSVARDH